MAELSLRPGTSRMLNRAWPDHPCVAVTWHCKIITTQLKALERLLVFIVPSLQLRERITLRDLEPNFSQISRLVLVHSKLIIYIYKQLIRAVAFSAVQSSVL